MQLAPIVARISTVAALNDRVQLAPTIDEAVTTLLGKTPPAVPMAVLTGAREKAAPSQRIASAPALHQVTCSFVVAICMRYSGNAMQAADALDSIVRSVRDVLIGWIPTGCDRQCYYQGGQLLPSNPGTLIWADSFDTTYLEDAL
jgi:hypothetical protein